MLLTLPETLKATIARWISIRIDHPWRKNGPNDLPLKLLDTGIRAARSKPDELFPSRKPTVQQITRPSRALLSIQSTISRTHKEHGGFSRALTAPFRVVPLFARTARERHGTHVKSHAYERSVVFQLNCTFHRRRSRHARRDVTQVSRAPATLAARNERYATRDTARRIARRFKRKKVRACFRQRISSCLSLETLMNFGMGNILGTT